MAASTQVSPTPDTARAGAPRLTAPPTVSWLGGHLDAFQADKLGFLTACAREHGDVVPLRFGPLRMWLVSDPDLIGEVFTQPAFVKDVGMRRAKVILGEGLFTSEGPEHDRR